MPNIDLSGLREIFYKRRSSAPLLLLILVLFCLAAGFIDIHQARSEQNYNKSTEIIALNSQPRTQDRSTLLQPPVSLKAWAGTAEAVPATSSPVAPVYDRIPTDQPVVFLGIDDGWTATPQAADWLKKHKLPFTLFLTNDAIVRNYGYFQDLLAYGSVVEDHSLHHSQFSKLSLDQQRQDICQTADIFGSVFGRRPTLFRPPYGDYNGATLVAAADCGMRAVIMWHATVDGGQIHYQDNNTSLMPGDIVLMHFRTDFTEDMQAFSQAAASQHLQVAKLEDWLP